MEKQEITKRFFERWGTEVTFSRNSEAGWAEFEQKIIKNKVILPEGNKLVVSTYCTNDETTYEQTFLSLQYFFVMLDRLEIIAKKKGKKLETGLCVYCEWDKEGQSGTAYRVRDYLCAQNFARPDLHLLIRTCNVEEEVIREKHEIINGIGKDPETEKYSGAKLSKIAPLMKIGRTGEEQISLNSFLGKCDFVSDKIKAYLNKKENNPKFNNIVEKGETIKLFKHLTLMQLELIREDLGKNDEWQGIFRELLEYLQERLNKNSFLTQMLWITMIHFFYEQGRIISKKGARVYKLESDVLEKTYKDVQAYAAGISELLENSCLYSQQNTGYLSIVVHEAKLSTTNAKTVGNARKREMLFRRYRTYNAEQVIEADEDYFLEVSLLDDAYDVRGEAGRGVMQTQGAEGYTLEELFDGKTSIDSEDRVLHHYGMPLFKREVVLNKGRFYFRSPNSEGKFDIYNAKRGSTKRGEEKRELYPCCTFYRLLLPLGYKSNQVFESINGKTEFYDINEAANLIEHLSIREVKYDDLWISGINIETENSGEFLEQGYKIPLIKEIIEKLCKNINIKSESLIAVHINDQISSKLEVFTKALVGTFCKLTPKKLVLVALYFENDEEIKEFVRYVSIFYDRTGQLNCMEKVQIALCGKDEYGENVVKMLLAGKELKSLRVTASSYSYYNSVVSLSLLTELQNIICTSETKSKEKNADSKDEALSVKIFPLDLILSGDFGELSCNIYDSWFLSRMKKILESDLQETRMGCKISNAHIRIGSKLHIKDFYEAELLFHNISYVHLFAYLVALDCKESLDDGKDIILIGYESYSEILITYLKHLLRNKGKEKRNIYLIKYLKAKNGREIISIDPGIDKKCISNALFINVLPIGTTLSTVYKIQNVVKRHLCKRELMEINEKLEFTKHYSLVLVDEEKRGEMLRQQYWKDSGNNKNEVVLEKEKSNEQGKTLVTYFLRICTEWYEPTSCPLCKTKNEAKERRRHVLVDVDKTSTMPAAIFPLKTSKHRGITFSIQNPEVNELFIDQLRECVTYGHIESEHNHFQFYIEFEEFYTKCKKNDEAKNLENWFRQQRNSIEKGMFNIIVSPLTASDHSFLCDVLEKVFDNDARLFCVEINTVLREDIRAKFSYFAEEFLEIYRHHSNIKINVYYVDNSIVTGQTLLRGEKLIRMLLEEAGVHWNDQVSLYRKVLILLNRSSYDTAATFVGNPCEDYCAAATLAIPSFNTQEGCCPTCELIETYEKIAKCSASNDIYWYYMWLAEKQKKRSLEENREWRRGRIVSDAHYFQELCVWLYINDENPMYKTLHNTLKDSVERKIHIADNVEADYSMFSEVVENLSLEVICEGEEETLKECIEIFEKYIFPEKTHKRLKITHEVISLLENTERWEWENIQELLLNGIREHVLLQNGSKAKRLMNLAIWVKVWAQGYIAKIAPVKSAVLEFLEELLLLILGKADEEEEYYWSPEECEGLKELFDIETSEVDVLLQIYRVYFIIAKNLCGLQSMILLEERTEKKTEEFWNNIEKNLSQMYCSSKNEDANLKITLTFLNKDLMQRDYIRYIKWLVMAGAEESKGYLLQELCTKMREGESEDYGEK